MCMKRHPSLVQPTSSNLQGVMLGSTLLVESVFLLESVLFLCLEDGVDLLAEEDGVRSTIDTSRLLDTLGVSSVTCLRLVSTLTGFGVDRLVRLVLSVGVSQLDIGVGGLG